MNKYPACKEVSTECLQKTVSYKMIVKYINQANSTSNLYVIYIKLAHNIKQSRRLVLVLENLISVIYPLFGRKRHFIGFRSSVFGLQNIAPHCTSTPLSFNAFVLIV